MVLAIESLHINTWNPILFIVALIVIAVVAVWAVARLSACA